MNIERATHTEPHTIHSFRKSHIYEVRVPRLDFDGISEMHILNIVPSADAREEKIGNNFICALARVSLCVSLRRALELELNTHTYVGIAEESLRMEPGTNSLFDVRRERVKIQMKFVENNFPFRFDENIMNFRARNR